MTKLAFVDTETTGLDPDRHEIWDVGLIVGDTEADHWEEHQWFLPVDLGRADAFALKMGHFYDRYPGATEEFVPWAPSGIVERGEFAYEFARLTVGTHLVGAVISFDEERLRKLLRANGACPDWHYHLVDVEAIVAGKLGIQPPWKSDDLGAAVGVEPLSDEERHTALGDAKWAMRIYAAVMGIRP